MEPILECVPNFSEGRDKTVLDRLAASFSVPGVTLLDVSADADHNRSVFTVIGSQSGLFDAVLTAIGTAVETIDMQKHSGQHPRMGAADVVPFIPVRGATLSDADALAKRVAAAAAERYALPIFLYERSAASPRRENLADVRKGQFEGMAAKLALPEWKPDFGPAAPHPTAGVTAVGARMPLIAYNVNLSTDRVELANDIAKKLRHLNGGFRFVKAMGVYLADRKCAQVSMNLTNYQGTSIYRVLETIRMEAARYGVSVTGSEIVGLTPAEALLDSAAYYLQLEGFSASQVLEMRLLGE